ncbi:Beige/BEACH domain protein [Dictyocaulus viviparus]|uniref:Beige/BEACH domain protein n=1 Tax=Dictyocaulus viviparus TaxID=29172 RepID=A0A0D8Y0F6_DICVI|nr:Beige/BEACH domain protein [Dictyocaulus viviparus]
MRIPLSGSRDIDPNRLLPLFTKVMAMFTPAELKVEFKEILNFSTFLCSVLVREIRQRASNHSTIEAASAIADYLQPYSSQRGWLLLNSIYFLISTDDEAIVNSACKVSLPSTLVKTVYLFFDLPENDELTERRQKLNELITCLLDRLSSYNCGIAQVFGLTCCSVLVTAFEIKNVSEELAKKDDLMLLFVGSSSSIPLQNVQWRKTTARIMEALSAKSLTPCVIKYIVTKECIRTYISNIKSSKIQPKETTEMIICLLCVLKDSARQTNQLIDVFNQSNGYVVIKDFILRNEDNHEIVRNILLMLISVITNGPCEIKAQHSSGLVQLPTFRLPNPSGSGLSVRNIQAFSLIYKSKSSAVCATVIDIVHSIYTCDSANYFILDKEYPLALFIEQMDRKDEVVRNKILELVEHCVFHLNYIPCKELIGLCVQMKTELASGQQDICIATVQAAFRLLTVDSLMKDAFREVGLLDTLCYIISNLFNLYKQQNLTEKEKKLALLATDLLTVIIKGNLENARMFSDCFGASTLLSILVIVSGEWRSSSLQLLKQLLLLASTDQYIAGVIQVISQFGRQQQLEFNVDLLKTVLSVLRESHKVRVQFRKTGGYLSLISMLLGLEDVFTKVDGAAGALPVEAVELLDFIHLIFKVLTISMRFEPSNAKYFSVEVGWDSITTVLRLTGAFGEATVIDVSRPEWQLQGSELKDVLTACHSVFKMDEEVQSGSIPDGMPPPIFFANYIIRLLFNMALDNYEKMSSDVTWTSSDGSLEDCIVSWTSSVLVHPGAVQSILSLLPSIYSTDVKWLVGAQYYSTLLLKALLKPERNQQLMCQVDMPRHLLSVASKLFLYLPLCCRNLDESNTDEPIRANEGGPVPLQRIKALVSMMTPRDQRLSHAPSFVEIDLAMEGFGCLFIPSLAPMFSTNRTERVFPSLNGFSLSTWLYIDAFSDKKVDAHPLRLLTITRTITWQDDRRKQGPCHLACLTIQISPMDRSLLISTDEHENPGNDLEKDAKFPSEKAIRVALADIIRPMEWIHICVVLSRSVLKPSQATVYVNGRGVSTQRLQYIVQTAGGAATQLAHTHVVNAVIGTLPSMRRPSRLRYRIASTFLVEEPLSAEVIRSIYDLQPHYVGSLQTAAPDKTALVPEEKIVFSLNGMATSEMTLAKIRAMHNKLDAEILAPYLGISSNDNSTPLRIMLNAVAHIPGGGRAFGAVIIGYLGMRTFIPRPVPRLLDSMGGFACLYGLVAMATDSEGLYASLKAVVSAVRSNSNLQTMLNVNRGYQTLAVLLEDKANLLNSHILHMVFSMAGTLDTAREIAMIPNSQAFEDLLCDLDVWAKAPEEQHKLLYEHFYELITDHQRENLTIVRRSPLFSRLLFVLFDRPYLLWSTNEIVFNLFSAIVQPQCDNRTMLKLGQAIAATIPTDADDLALESQFPFHISELHNSLIAKQKPDEEKPSVLYMVYIRNRLLNMVANFLSHSSPSLNQHMADQIARVLGFDWIYCLLSPGVHSGTVYLALRILLSMLAHTQLLAKFREGTSNGGWLADADSVVVLGFSVSAHGGAVGSKIDINPELQNCAGFAALEHLMAAHADKPHAYLAMLAVLVGQPVKDLRFCENFNVEQIWTHVFGLSLNSSVYEAIRSAEFCYDALIPLLSMALQGWCIEYPSAVVQMITFLYQNSPSFFAIAHSEEFVLAMFSSLIQNLLLVLALQSSKGILDFLKKLFCDDFQITPSGRNDSLIDVITESISENGCARKSQIVTLTAVIHEIFDHLISTGLLVSSSLPPNAPPQPLSQVGVNISYMAHRSVDCLWNGLLVGDPLKLFQLLHSIYGIASRKENKVAVCASRVWTDVILSKKALLEEAFKRPTVCELNAARALLANVAGQHWHQFVDSQLSGNYHNHTASKDIHTQISSKITRVASGLHKLASKRPLSSHGSINSVLPWKIVSIDKEASVLDKYKLDTTEGPSRTRRKMIPNRFFYHVFPYRPHLDDPSAKSMRAKVAISRDSELYFNACRRRRGRVMNARIIDYSVTVSTPSEEKPAFTFCDLAQLNSSLIRRLSLRPCIDVSEHQKVDDSEKDNENGEENGSKVKYLFFCTNLLKYLIAFFCYIFAIYNSINFLKEPSVELEDDQQDESSASEKPMSESREGVKEEDKKEDEKDSDNRKKRGPDNQTLLRLLEQGEQLHSMFRCARIQGLETSEGLLLFGREHYYVVDGFTLLKTREIRDLDFLSQDLHDPIVPYTGTGATHPPRSSRLCSKFSYEDIREVHKRRYLLQPIALEVFSADGRNYLLAFPKKMRDRVYEKLLSMAKGLTACGSDSVSGQKANMAIEQSGRASLLNSIIGQQSVTQRWLNGQITNFQYLIHLNTLAGRSYNDLSQYPVLPWILADYSSTTLDFTNPKTFRDLSKPMGAQHPQRLEQFLKRYREWDDPTGETPPYMYGTHYSSAMIVVSYLVRLEPFTQQFLSLQGGHFDLADRMFHSIGDAWASASRNNMADVKELIPEFFVLPELFLNSNHFDFGIKQNGVALGDVVLPPWAHGDAREFIRLHRQALECDYVSSHLHEWIDLVFGYKQNGEEAVKSIIDPLTRNATIGVFIGFFFFLILVLRLGFVNNFGQIPTQLFKKPHPQKKVSPVDGFSNTPGVTTQRLFYHCLHSLKPPQSPIKELRSAVGSIYQNDRIGVVALEQNKILIGSNRYIAWGFPDRSIRMGQVDSDKSTCIHEMCDADELTCVANGDDRTLFCGSNTGCVSVWTLHKKPVSLKRRKLLDGHSDAVTCLVVCSAHAFVVSASRDCSVILWHQSELYLIRQLPLHPSPVSAVAINDTTGDIATSCATLLHLWSINGDLLAVVNTCDSNLIMDPSQMILCITFSTMNEWDSDNVVVCGTSDGVVKIYSCVMVENDGSVEAPHIEPQLKPNPSSSATVHARLDRVRRRLKKCESQDTSEAQSPDPPTSPISSTSLVEGIDRSSCPQYVRVLMQRAALTAHTAFNRPDNTHPAPITCLAPSRDHKAFLVGDGIGRLWCWQAGEDGGRADHWVQDVARQRCTQCQHKFSIADRKHHCRNCGQIFCSKCSRFESHITHMKISRPVRVCQNCFLRLQAQL